MSPHSAHAKGWPSCMAKTQGSFLLPSFCSLLELGRHIDWTFVSGPVQINKGRVHNSIKASNHYPISFEIRSIQWARRSTCSFHAFCADRGSTLRFWIRRLQALLIRAWSRAVSKISALQHFIGPLDRRIWRESISD